MVHTIITFHKACTSHVQKSILKYISYLSDIYKL